LPAVWRERRAATWLCYGLLVLAVFGSFTLLSLGPVRAQRCAEMVSCWDQQFPHWERPHTVPSWVVFSTLDVLRYCCKPLGQLLGIFALVGAIVLWRTGRRALVVLLTAPLGLALIAAGMHAYPYGGVRVEVFTAPALVLLIAAGVPPTFAWLSKWSEWQRAFVFHRRVFSASLRSSALILLLLPLGFALYRVAVPWERPDCASAANYVLAHCQSQDEINANQWMYPYYFRGRLPPLRLMRDDQTWLGSGVRQWVIITADQAEDRTAIVQALPLQSWRVLDWRTFAFTTVLLVEKR